MRNIAFILLTLMTCMMISCRSERIQSEPASDSDVVAQYRDTLLRMSDVIRQLPPGISSADSASLSHSIINGWIDGFLIEDLAASQIDDMDRIQMLTEEYRRSLIADSYRHKMRSSGVQPVNTNGVRQYYHQHKSELKLERPIIRGLFIKLPASSRYIEDVRHWMKAPMPESYDELENIGRKETVVFRYFVDQWVDFDAISEEIPFRFGDYDKFVEKNPYFETEYNATVYILHISDFRHSGGLMPEEYATPIIEDRIKNNYLADYEKGLLKALRQTAIQKNILKIEDNYMK